jgi:lysophospholipase L1-like esterase
VNATSALQAKGAETPLLYFPSDMHLTAAGHRALAEAVQGEVRAALDQMQSSP